MESSWVGTILWRQYDAAIDMLDTALVACPDALWTERLWPDPPPPWFPPQFGEFWYVSFHTLIWLDIYLSGLPEEAFAPPAPFTQGEIDSHEAMPEQPYAREQLRTYLSSLRQRCQSTLVALTGDEARRPVDYPWTKHQPMSYLELQLYNLRHVQEHAAQLSLFLGQQTNADTEPGWVPRATADPAEQ